MEQAPTADAIVEDGARLTYGALWDQAAALAERLGAIGVDPGHRVVLALPPVDHRWVVALLGTLAAGGQAVVPDPDWGPGGRPALVRALGPVATIDDGDEVTWLGRGSTPSRAEAGMWLFTSGTTAEPKPCFRSSRALAAMLRRLHARLPEGMVRGRPVCVCPARPSHGFGLLNGVLLVHSVGGALHSVAGLEPRAVCRLIEEREVYAFYGRPSDFESLVGRQLWKGPRSTALEWCVSSSSHLDVSVAARFAEETGCPVRQQTETGPLCLDDGEVPDPLTVGRPLDQVELQIAVPDGLPLPAGRPGLVRVRFAEGPAPALDTGPDGWFRTGDVGWTDSAGRVFLTGREQPFSDERAGFEERR